MARADQITALIKSHVKDDRERFLTVALQLAASEAQKGHTSLAREIRNIIDNKKSNPVKVISISHELDDLIISGNINGTASLVVREDLKSRIERIIREFHQHEKLAKHGLNNRRKILLAGPPGTGKTMTAAVLAEKSGLPFYIVQIDRLVTKYMGETSAKLRQIFSIIRERPGVYLFDEFDAIGSQRGQENDVGEMGRVLNALLQFIEEDNSKSLIVAATNRLGSLDKALFRRFDDVLHYEKPTKEEIASLIDNRLGSFKGRLSLKIYEENALGLSHAEITQACDDAIKEAVLADRKSVTKSKLLEMLADRKTAYGIQSNA